MRLADKCSFCPANAYDSVEIEAGNNAEVKIIVHCCHEHMMEMDIDIPAFDKKYADIINRLVSEHGVQS